MVHQSRTRTTKIIYSLEANECPPKWGVESEFGTVNSVHIGRVVHISVVSTIHMLHYMIN